MRYAENTSVPVEKSRAEIETILQRYGADAFQYGWSNTPPQSLVQFRAQNRVIRFVLPLPDKNAEEFWSTPAKRNRRTAEQAHKAWEQACRQRWRALTLAIKAKLEAVETGIAEFEEEFLAYIVDPESQRTVGELIRPQLEGNEPKPMRLEYQPNAK